VVRYKYGQVLAISEDLQAQGAGLSRYVHWEKAGRGRQGVGSNSGGLLQMVCWGGLSTGLSTFRFYRRRGPTFTHHRYESCETWQGLSKSKGKPLQAHPSSKDQCCWEQVEHQWHQLSYWYQLRTPCLSGLDN
jgi:hypothetical protein